MKKEQIEAFGKRTPGPWAITFRQKWPFGVTVYAGDKCVLMQDAYCSSTGQNTRADNEAGRGFKAENLQAARDAIAEQDANAIAFAALPDLIAERTVLLEALKAADSILWMAEKYAEGGSTEREDCTAAYVKIKSALAKAEGEQP